MLTLAQLIKLVLDELYSDTDLPNDAAKDAAINERLEQLSASYSRLKSAQRAEIDYSDPISRFAYIYKYTVAHSDYIKQLINGNRSLQALFDAPEVSVACIGGGPGCDLLGILKYMILAGCTSTLTSYLFDRERAWGDSWSEVARPLKANFQLYPVFQQLDATDPTTWKSYKKFLRAELFTLSYFVSELWTLRDRAEPFFKYCFTNARPGAYFLFIDNNDSDFVGWYDGMAAAYGVEHIRGVACRMAFSIDEEKMDLEPYYSKFGWPKRESNVCFRISRKG